MRTPPTTEQPTLLGEQDLAALPRQTAIQWRTCAGCGKPVHPDAKRCGWCGGAPLRYFRLSSPSVGSMGGGNVH